jgi:demethylmenaquinone methyltransferase/2-methoxy-6-polyprenyl-1,4-benzoquinol methylase
MAAVTILARMTDQLSPHPPLSQYYGEPAQRERFVRAIFDETAEWYDDIDGMLSLGSGDRYRRDALLRGGLAAGMRLLDVATGTGVVARAAATITEHVAGMDASIGMLLAGRVRQHLPMLQGVGERLPLRDASFDMLTTGYALRHFADLRAVFSEYHRVLRPGGRVLILEITPPRSRLGYALLRFHLNAIVPLLARLRSRSRKAAKLMHYYWDTTAACVPPESILDALSQAGFDEAGRHVELGVMSEYTATKR